jgi:FKBP-type peptidyl-prolyl cis-trans isomerase
MLMTPGDSAIFRISVDSLKKAGAQLLPWMQDGDKLMYEVVLVSVKSADQLKQEQEKHAAAQKGIDDQLLQDYFTKNKLKPLKTASGLYYVITKQGTGAAAKPGQYVTVNYTGKTLDGKPFDSNIDPQFNHVQPFSFQLGKGQVIKGWDEGIALIKKGGKGTLFIPSNLAYGERGAGGAIQPNAVLMFDVEVKDVTDTAPAPATPPGHSKDDGHNH